MKSPKRGTRPTTDLVRGAIYDTLTAQRADLSRVLDLYAGSGALGIESLSRGDGECDFVERFGANAAMIGENLRLIGFQRRGRVYRMDVNSAVERLTGPYSLILADPPYDAEEAMDALRHIAGSPLVNASTILVLERSSRSEPIAQLGRLHRWWNRQYGDTQVSIYRAGEAALADSRSAED